MGDHIYEEVAGSSEAKDSEDEVLSQEDLDGLHENVSPVSRLYLFFLTVSMGG